MSTKSAFKDVEGDLKEAVHNVQKLLSDLRHGLSSAVGNGVEAGKTAVEATESRIEDVVNSTKSAASGLLESTAKKIGQSPMTSILVAAGIGFFSGFLISRK